VQRDLKPGNVMLVRRTGLSGTPVAKLLDFGLAKLAADVPAGASVMTAAQPLTQQGTILGTCRWRRSRRFTTLNAAKGSEYEPVARWNARGLSPSRSGRRGGIWIKDLTRGTITRVTFGAHSFGEAWHPDGRHLAFTRGSPPGATAASDSVTALAMTTANGTGDVERLVASKAPNMWPFWSPDARVLIYQVGTAYNSPSDIWVLPMDTRQPVPFIHGPANEGQPAFSPDGRWVAYVSDETGRLGVYVQPYPANGDKWTISTSGGLQPQWRADGKELFFLSATRQMQAVDVGVRGDRFEAGVPRSLFTTRAALVAGPMGPFRAYGVAADGQSFLIDEVPPDVGQRRDPLVVIVNWTSLLRR
jgi:dipeptidyl aminopeptidase/acylaminoacyl peptidase